MINANTLPQTRPHTGHTNIQVRELNGTSHYEMAMLPPALIGCGCRMNGPSKSHVNLCMQLHASLISPSIYVRVDPRLPLWVLAFQMCIERQRRIINTALSLQYTNSTSHLASESKVHINCIKGPLNWIDDPFPFPNENYVHFRITAKHTYSYQILHTIYIYACILPNQPALLRRESKVKPKPAQLITALRRMLLYLVSTTLHGLMLAQLQILMLVCGWQCNREGQLSNYFFHTFVQFRTSTIIMYIQ